jgi:hypothetical protein
MVGASNYSAFPNTTHLHPGKSCTKKILVQGEYLMIMVSATVIRTYIQGIFKTGSFRESLIRRVR